MVVISDPSDTTATAARNAPTTTPIAIIGAGPYGLSIAAHLRARGIEHRIFGVPMETWRTQMPRGMFLKSEGFASSLSDANDSLTLGKFCTERRLPYANVGIPVALQTFSDYGMAFQERYVPNLDARKITQIAPTERRFTLTLEDGTKVIAQRVVVAVGISHYAWLPPELAALPKQYVSHTAAHHKLDAFAGRSVTVIGSGASAVDMAGLLHEAGARTALVARTKALVFHNPPNLRPSLYERVRRPRSGLGQGFKSLFYSNFPDLFARLPAARRVRTVRTALGPSACYFTKAQIVGKVTTHLGLTIESAAIADERVVLKLRDSQSNVTTVESDHVIAGTGYRVDLSRLDFIPDGLRSQIELLDGSPIVNRNFESSVPGLYFVGVSAATSFGPLLRFAYGARFAAKRLASHAARVVRSRTIAIG